MKITMLSRIDYAGSGHKLCEAIRLHTEHDIKIFTGDYYNPYRHPDNSRWDRKEVQQRIDSSDIVHLKGDWPPKDGYLGFKIMHKPIVITVSGSHFRKKWLGGYERYKIEEYKPAILRTAFTPDLCYDGFSDIWTPHPVDSSKLKRGWEPTDLPILMHIPTRREVKGTDFVFDVFGKLKERMKVETLVIENVPFKKVIEERKRATIYFDQFTVGFYGNSAIEAMAYGIPVAAWIRHEALQKNCPVITEEKNADKWADKIEGILKNSMIHRSIQTKIWCDEKHSYESVARQWNDLYELVTI